MRRLTIIATLLVMTSCMAAVRLHTYDEPLEMDAATYAVIAREMLVGRSLYSDLWDHKPPAIHATFVVAQVVAGAGPAHTFLLGLLAASIALVGVYAATAAMAGQRVGLLGAAIWTLVSADMMLRANQPNTEAFINAVLVWAFAGLVTIPLTHYAWTRAVCIGLLLALASLYKHVALATGIVLLAAHFYAVSASPAARRRAAAQVSIAIAVVTISWSGVCAYFSISGRWDAFWNAVFTFNRQYAGSTWDNVANALVLDQLIAPALYPLLPLLVLTILGLLTGGPPARRRGRALLTAYAIGTVLAVALPGRFSPHYYQLWLPLLAIGGAVGVAALRPVVFSERVWLGRAGAVILAVLVVVELPALTLDPQEWSRRKFGERLLESEATARTLNGLLLRDETFFQWGPTAELYYYSGRRVPGGEFRSDHLLSAADGPRRTARLVDALTRQPPELVLVSRWHAFPPDHPVPRWLMERYAKVDSIGGAMPGHNYDVWVRRGGALEGRLAAGVLASAQRTS